MSLHLPMYLFYVSNKSIGGEGSSDDGYLLWHNRLATETVNNATKNLPPTQGPSHFVLTAHEVLPPIFPTKVYILR